VAPDVFRGLLVVVSVQAANLIKRVEANCGERSGKSGEHAKRAMRNLVMRNPVVQLNINYMYCLFFSPPRVAWQRLCKSESSSACIKWRRREVSVMSEKRARREKREESKKRVR
jgi:hypothetical protein